ncbi:MAG: DoxX family protein [Cyclobacteriaceae bacterium]|nr:DoxX family protein [Cyclobacteriaceae bacterium]
MKTTKIIFWITTGIIVAFDGLIPLLSSHTELAKQGVMHLGYPDYFRFLIMPFKVLGALALILPSMKGRYKEWAYAGFGINFICASVSHGAVDGLNFQTFFPLIFLVLLVISYVQYHKIQLAH